VSLTGGPIFVPATSNAGTIDQPRSFPLTLAITEVGTGKNLLTMNFTGDIKGTSGAITSTLAGSDATGNTVTFSSAFLTFSQPGDSYSVTLGSMSPALSIGPGGFLNSFVSGFSGSFTANASSVSTTPEPASRALLALGALALIRRR
jgi:MYXO-CTERM domain-containing protein